MPDDAREETSWPALLRVRPQIVLTNVIVFVAMAWVGVLLLDVYLGIDLDGHPLWVALFNDGRVEWLQWFLLPATAVAAAYQSARLETTGEREPAGSSSCWPSGPR